MESGNTRYPSNRSGGLFFLISRRTNRPTNTHPKKTCEWIGLAGRTGRRRTRSGWRKCASPTGPVARTHLIRTAFGKTDVHGPTGVSRAPISSKWPQCELLRIVNTSSLDAFPSSRRVRPLATSSPRSHEVAAPRHARAAQRRRVSMCSARRCSDHGVCGREKGVETKRGFSSHEHRPSRVESTSVPRHPRVVGLSHGQRFGPLEKTRWPRALVHTNRFKVEAILQGVRRPQLRGIAALRAIQLFYVTPTSHRGVPRSTRRHPRARRGGSLASPALASCLARRRSRHACRSRRVSAAATPRRIRSFASGSHTRSRRIGLWQKSSRASRAGLFPLRARQAARRSTASSSSSPPHFSRAVPRGPPDSRDARAWSARGDRLGPLGGARGTTPAHLDRDPSARVAPRGVVLDAKSIAGASSDTVARARAWASLPPPPPTPRPAPPPSPPASPPRDPSDPSSASFACTTT